jgi:rsbT co-antagonist protein RsbR
VASDGVASDGAARLLALREKLGRLLSPDDGAPPQLPGADRLAQLESGVALLAAEMARLRGDAKEAVQRLASFSDMVGALVSNNYAYRLEISEKGDIYDGVAYNLNMLAEELSATTVSQEYVDNILQSMSESILVAEPSGAIKTVNRGCRSVFGYEEAELLGQDIRKLLPQLPLDEVIRRGHLSLDESTLRTRYDGQLPIAVSCAVMKNKMEELQGIVFVVRDLTESKRGEAERWRLREAMQRQSILLVELSTPIIPITDEIVVVPLIGTIDEERAKQMADTVLSGVVARRARCVIVDVTGVSAMDQAATRGIISTFNGLRLLGTHVVLTGIRPEVAAALVTQGTDVSGITTAASLQSGIQHALRLRTTAHAAGARTSVLGAPKAKDER